MLPDTLGHLFDIPLRLAPSSVAVIQGDATLTYQDLDAWCNRAANALAGLGVRAGHRVALMFSNDWRFLPAFLGPMRIGAVSVPLNIRMGDEALAYVIQDAEATVLIAGRDQADRARRLASQVKGLAHLVADAPPADGALEWDAWLAGGLPALPPPPDRSGLGLHAAVHLRLDREAQGRPPRPPWSDLERGHHPEDGVPRRHGAGAGRGAALSQERHDRRGEAVSPRRRVARDPPRLRPGRGHPRHRPPPGHLPHRRAGHVQADARREGDPRPAQRPVHPLRALRVCRGAGGAPRRVPAGVRRADRRVVRPDGGRAGPDGEPALWPQEARLLRRRRRQLSEPHRLHGRRRHRLRRRRGGRARHPEPRARQGVLEAARRSRPRRSATAGSSPAT